MKVCCVSFAFVSAVLFAALGASPGSAGVSELSAMDGVQAGYAALSSGDATKAVPLFSQSIESRELGPDALANAFFNRGLSYQQLGQSGNAIDDYTAALNLDAMTSALRARVLYNRGLAQEQLKHLAPAIEDFTSSLLIEPGFAHAYFARANTLRDSGQYLFSISDYERAIKYHHPESAKVYFAEALTYAALKRLDETRKLLQAAIGVDANFAPAISMLQAMGESTQSDNMVADPVLTGSNTASPTAATNVLALALPKAIEPPDALLVQDRSADQSMSIGAIDNAEASTAQAVPAAPIGKVENRVVVASVPKVPAIGKPVQLAMVTLAPKLPQTCVAASIPEAKPVEPAQGWAVQISSADSADAAWASWKAMVKTHASLASAKPVVVKADLGAKGTVYRLRLPGFDTQAAAQASCGKLKAAGVACFIAKASG